MEISALETANPGDYLLKLYATSMNNVSYKAYLDINVEVINQNTRVPKRVRVTSGSAEEMDPSVTAFTDTNGHSWVFVVYKKLTPITNGGNDGGWALMVKYAQLNSDGTPGTWNGPIQLTTLNEAPNDPRIMVAKGGNYDDRVYVIWTGDDPSAAHDQHGTKGSWGRITWADRSDYSSWHAPVTIDKNTGSSTYNVKSTACSTDHPTANLCMYMSILIRTATVRQEEYTMRTADPQMAEPHGRTQAT